jgi:hypothetical protein
MLKTEKLEGNQIQLQTGLRKSLRPLSQETSVSVGSSSKIVIKVSFVQSRVVNELNPNATQQRIGFCD